MRHPEHPAIIQTLMLTLIVQNQCGGQEDQDQGQDSVGGYKSLVAACGEDNVVFMTNITNTSTTHLLHSPAASTRRGEFWVVTRIYISVSSQCYVA